jgi:hypothetical protein
MLTFSALRYSDGATVVGTITPDGTIDFTSTSSGYYISDMVLLN